MLFGIQFESFVGFAGGGPSVSGSRRMSDVLKRHGLEARASNSDASAAVVIREPALFRVLASACVDRFFEAFPTDAIAIASLTYKVVFQNQALINFEIGF